MISIFHDYDPSLEVSSWREWCRLEMVGSSAHEVRKTSTLLCVCLLILLVSGAGTAAGSTTVSISPASSELQVGAVGSYEIIVDPVDGGVGAFELTIRIEESKVASISNLTIHGNPGLTDVEYSGDRSSVRLSAAIMDTNDTGSVTIVTFRLKGEGTGSTGINLELDALGDESGQDYQVDRVRNASLSVGGTTVSPTPTESATATTTSSSTTSEGDQSTASEPTTATDTAGSTQSPIGTTEATTSPGATSASESPDRTTTTANEQSPSTPTPTLIPTQAPSGGTSTTVLTRTTANTPGFGIGTALVAIAMFGILASRREGSS